MTLKVYGVDTVIVFTRIFGAHFIISSLFVLFLFDIFQENSSFLGTLFTIFASYNVGRAHRCNDYNSRKKYNNFHFLAEDE